MHATTATPLAGGSGRSPLSKDSAYSALFCNNSSVTLIFPCPFLSPYTANRIGIRAQARGRFNRLNRVWETRLVV